MKRRYEHPKVEKLAVPQRGDEIKQFTRNDARAVRHPSHNFTYSASLRQEAAAEQNDVIALPMNEGRPSTNKTIGDLKWGNEAEIGLSRKVFRWFDMALRLFPTVRYFAKADDDTFLRVPQYLLDLRTLPRRGVYWGLRTDATARKNNVIHEFHYFSGMLYTLARDVVQQLVSFEPVRRLVDLPYNKEREGQFLYYNMQHEDVMVGQILRLEVRDSTLVVVEDSGCRFHSGRGKNRTLHVTPASLALHLPPVKGYSTLMELGGHSKRDIYKLWKCCARHMLRFVC
ncbi:putative UDP-Gal or UDP-GlcNAc-dependent glycosyltransferase [Trypanosoma grayi]|uniref:putative UDP-Gal or UDP-GlcNAc-dependent glycosyltransferase n=1 Tax=Trypanosoma grayi TaxID=71804 RepID=UPI0004F44BDB|nr:putative UDP-Gal or UDP-GlcNAc-dependent glycosyltransferase [Trypanosoma grayi]KEG10438.1 putative UDP-Gal or UDP-GlcNAc-dependent glycosyltransferase [Trypanosoma grayi]